MDELLKAEILSATVAQYQLRRCILQRTPILWASSGLTSWTAESKRLRKQSLSGVVFHGWLKEWVKAPAWFFCSELDKEPNQRWYGAHLDLVGV